MKFYALILSIMLMGCSTATTEQTESSQNEEDDLIKLKDVEGNKINLKNYADSALFINLWATWCAPCIKEMPSLERMEQALSAQPIVFFYSSNEPRNRIKKFRENNPWDFNYAFLDMSLAELDIQALPTTLIIGRDGTIIFKETGSRDWDTEESIAEIKELIK